MPQPPMIRQPGKLAAFSFDRGQGKARQGKARQGKARQGSPQLSGGEIKGCYLQRRPTAVTIASIQAGCKRFANLFQQGWCNLHEAVELERVDRPVEGHAERRPHHVEAEVQKGIRDNLANHHAGETVKRNGWGGAVPWYCQCFCTLRTFYAQLKASS